MASSPIEIARLLHKSPLSAAQLGSGGAVGAADHPPPSASGAGGTTLISLLNLKELIVRKIANRDADRLFLLLRLTARNPFGFDLG